MSLDSNAQCDGKGNPLRHFTPYPTPGSSGVNVFNQDLSVCDGNHVNAYVFPRFSLIGPLLRLFASANAAVTIVVPKLSPLPGWWPLLNVLATRRVLVAKKGSADVLLFPSRHGFLPRLCPYDLWAFRIVRSSSWTT